MIRATRVLRRAERGARASADTITLSREERWRRRIAMQSDNGLAFLLDLPEATYLAQGDALELSDGRLIEVRAAAEDLLEIRAVDALALARIAWHIGNRHTPAEITPAAIYIQADHVLAEMAAGLGAEVTRVNRPFEPEGGAYDGAKGRFWKATIMVQPAPTAILTAIRMPTPTPTLMATTTTIPIRTRMATIIAMATATMANDPDIWQRLPEAVSDASGADKVSSGGQPRVDPLLLVWLSPSFPVGAFAYSHGLELAVDRGWIADRIGLEAWLRDLVVEGSLRSDLILLAAAWRAAAANDNDAIADVNELALALQPSAERRLESVTQGGAFARTIADAWRNSPTNNACTTGPDAHDEIAYSVAVGVATGRRGMQLEGVLLAYAIAFAGNLVSAAIRLGVTGQTGGQQILAALMPSLEDSARNACCSSLDGFGSATLRSDLASLAHETQYSRLFRS